VVFLLLVALGVTLASCATDGGAQPEEPVAVTNLFGERQPMTVADADTEAVELGVRFQTSVDGEVTGVRFFKSAENTGTHQGTLWTDDGTALATATFTDETASGWQTVTFDEPVKVSANGKYVASYHTTVGRYSADTDFFKAPTTNGPLTAAADHVSSRTSVYSYGSRSRFPTQSWGRANYWVDVNFAYNPGQSTPPTTAAPETTVPTTSAPVTQPRPTTTTTTQPRPTTTTTAPPMPTTTTTAPAPPPASGAYPSAADTGVPSGVQLSTYTGPSIITQAGTVIDAKLVTTCLTVRAANVTITRSKIQCAGDFGVNQSGGSGLVIRDTEITSASSSRLIDRAIQLGGGATVERTYVHGTQRGIAIVGDNVSITDTYVGGNTNGTDAHSSAIGAWGGADNVVLRHNTLRTERGTNASSSISIYPESGPNTNWTIDDNLLSSGGAYVLYAGYTPSAGERPNTGIVFINNKFNTDNYVNSGESGPVASWSNTSNTWSNNTWYDLRPTTSGYTNKNGKPVNP
jgi:hypothetical protein